MKRSQGVTILGIILIVGALYHIWILYSAGYAHYQYLHQEYSPQVIQLRYIVSWFIKIAGLVLGIGILKLNEWYRKGTILSSVLIILTVHLKHSYAAYSLHMQHLEQAYGSFGGITFSSLIWPALILQRGLDIVFSLIVIYFLTRPKVRNQFLKKENHGGN